MRRALALIALLACGPSAAERNAELAAAERYVLLYSIRTATDRRIVELGGTARDPDDAEREAFLAYRSACARVRGRDACDARVALLRDDPDRLYRLLQEEAAGLRVR